jgi:hypothetical protein
MEAREGVNDQEGDQTERNRYGHNPVTGRCEKIDPETWSNFGLEKKAPGCVISDRWGFGIHFGCHEIPPSRFFHIVQTVRNPEKPGDKNLMTG